MSWLDVVPERDRSELEPSFRVHRYRAGSTIVGQGQSGTDVYVIDVGHAVVRVATARGQSVTTAVLGPGASFGEVAHLRGEDRRTASVVALDAMTVRRLSGETFADIRGRVPAITEAMAAALAERLHDLSTRFSELAIESVQRRCGRRLVELAELFAEGGASSATVPLNQEDLVGIVGATRATIDQVLGHLQFEELVSLHEGAIKITDRYRLADHVR